MPAGWLKYFLLLLLCVGTRCLTAIYYMEDIDSLRFALAASDFNIAELRPHFPGYPVHIFLLQGLYILTGSVGLSFAILGGLATWLILVAALRIWAHFTAAPPYLPGILVFFNPLLWLMSTRYMPDILGLGLLMIGMGFLLQALTARQLNS
ncbi:MAG: hypothetical protein AAGB22_05315, partial [Bacteroidota bacterium]